MGHVSPRGFYLPEVLGLAQLHDGRALDDDAPRVAPLSHLAADVEHRGLVLDVPHLLDRGDQTVAQLGEVDARAVTRAMQGKVMWEEERQVRIARGFQLQVPLAQVARQDALEALMHILTPKPPDDAAEARL